MLINIIELFEKGALKKCPDKIAIIEGEQQVSFRDMEKTAKALASALIISGASFNRCVAIMLKNGIDILTADMAALYSGNFYSNLDVKSPKDRLRHIWKNLAPAFVITDGKYAALARELGASDNQIINIEKIDSSVALPSEEILKRLDKVIDADPSCVINTSGSTGIPKSCVLSHRGLIDYAFWSMKAMKLTGEEISGVIPAFYFDGYLTAFFNCIGNGASFVIAPESVTAFPMKMAEYFSRHNISFIFWVPSVLAMFASNDILSKINLSSLKTVCFAGEVFNASHYNYWKSRIPEAKYINLYGPIEISVICTYYIVDRDFKNDEPIPIGKGCRNTDILLIKEDGAEAGKGEQGEICVRGSSLAMGYYNDPEKTSAAFVPNPLNPHYPEIIYKTGDTAYYNEREELIFVGRKDFQIKHMGYRIELGEIECVASSLEGVKHVCVLYEKVNKTIAMFYEALKEIEPGSLRRALGETLPKYALPTVFYHMKELPRNPNGKIDRQKLTEIMTGAGNFGPRL